MLRRFTLCACVLMVMCVSSPSQGRVRTVKRPTVSPNEPVVVSRIKVGDASMDPDTGLPSGSDWLRQLSLEVRNISPKNIVYAAINIDIQPEGSSMTVPISVVTKFGQRPCTRSCGKVGPIDFGAITDLLKPGEVMTFRIPDSALTTVYRRLSELHADPVRVRLIYDLVVFSDGTAWSQGSDLRVDPNDNERWILMDNESGEQNAKLTRSPGFLKWPNLIAAVMTRPDEPQLFDWGFLFETKVRRRAKGHGTSTSFDDPTQCVWRFGRFAEPCNQVASWCSPNTLYCTYMGDSVTEEPQASLSGYMKTVEITCIPPEECEFCGGTTRQVQQYEYSGYCNDFDHDGYTAASGDCDDACGSCNPGNYYENLATVGCGDSPNDNDCDGYVDCDDPDCWPDVLCSGNSPILIDLNGDGFALTNAPSGVLFDLNHDGRLEQLAWTRLGSDDSWLSLDRNGNGQVDDGAELFGNHTPQPDPAKGISRNGFLALAEFDKPANGGNADGRITATDSIYPRLRLWTDSNHDGRSSPSELHPLMDFGVDALDLSFHETKRRDRYGNEFRYRAQVLSANRGAVGRWAWDVLLVSNH